MRPGRFVTVHQGGSDGGPATGLAEGDPVAHQPVQWRPAVRVPFLSVTVVRRRPVARGRRKARHHSPASRRGSASQQLCLVVGSRWSPPQADSGQRGCAPDGAAWAGQPAQTGGMTRVSPGSRQRRTCLASSADRTWPARTRSAAMPAGSAGWSGGARRRLARPPCSRRAWRPVARWNSISATGSEPSDGKGRSDGAAGGRGRGDVVAAAVDAGAGVHGGVHVAAGHHGGERGAAVDPAGSACEPVGPAVGERRLCPGAGGAAAAGGHPG